VLNPSMANFGVLRVRRRASGKIPPPVTVSLQKRKRSLDAHGGSVNLDANSSIKQGPSRKP